MEHGGAAVGLSPLYRSGIAPGISSGFTPASVRRRFHRFSVVTACRPFSLSPCLGSTGALHRRFPPRSTDTGDQSDPLADLAGPGRAF